MSSTFVAFDKCASADMCVPIEHIENVLIFSQLSEIAKKRETVIRLVFVVAAAAAANDAVDFPLFSILSIETHEFHSQSVSSVFFENFYMSERQSRVIHIRLRLSKNREKDE